MAHSRTELFGLLHGDLFFQGKLLENGVNVKIELMCIKDSFCLISSPAAGTGHYICLFVKKVWVAPGLCLGHTGALLMANAK